MARFLALALVALACTSGSSGSGGGSGAAPGPTGPSGGGDAPSAPSGPPGWAVAAREDFETGAIPAGAFSPDPVPDDGPFADAGVYFTQPRRRPADRVPRLAARRRGRLAHDRGVHPPRGRAARGLRGDRPGPRRPGEPRAADRLAGPHRRDRGAAHAPAAREVPRLAARRASRRSATASPGSTATTAARRPGPWWPADDATRQNGFYWLAILDHVPRPHNNTWIHHHRKVVVDSDNHYPPWMEIWDGSRFVSSGEHPVMMFALDGRGADDARSGNAVPLLVRGRVAALGRDPGGGRVPARTPGTGVTVERDGPSYTRRAVRQVPLRRRADLPRHDRRGGALRLALPGDGRGGGGRRGCEDASPLPSPRRRATRAGPRAASGRTSSCSATRTSNYYEGEVLYDDVTLELWR